MEFTIAVSTAIKNFDDKPNWLSSPEMQKSPVLMILEHWLVRSTIKPINPQKAYELWLKAQTVDCTFIANLLKKQDRIAASKYIITGDLLGGTTGSVVMFS
jgi:hypothetical protein